MKLIILSSIILLLNSSCITVEDGIREAEVHCNRLFNDQGFVDKDKWSKREYIHCVSNLTNARQNQRSGNALKGLVVTGWVATFVSFIIGLVAAG